MQEKQIRVEGDAGLVVAGDATHDGATANNQVRNVINIHHNGTAMNDAKSLAMDGRMSRVTECEGCATARQQQARMRVWLFATSSMALAASGVAAFFAVAGAPATDTTLALQRSLCHHEGKVHSPGGIARMADGQLYVCAPAPAAGVAFWEPAAPPAKQGSVRS
jgi:hypothetical protein